MSATDLVPTMDENEKKIVNEFCHLLEKCSDVPRLQQVEQKAVGRQKNLGLYTRRVVHLITYASNYAYLFDFTTKNLPKTIE
jgi:hypothetical protein